MAGTHETDQSADAEQPIAPLMHHVNLKTIRLSEMIEWYGTVVGMRVNFAWDQGAFLGNDAANHRVALISVPGLFDDPDKLAHTGIHHSAFEYGTLGELLATYRRLKRLGITPHMVLDHGMTTSFYYVDPDGNSVELQVDNFGDWEASSEWLRTSPSFAANPIGAFVDPDRICAEFDAGATAAELHERGYAGEFEPSEPMSLRFPPPPA